MPETNDKKNPIEIPISEQEVEKYREGFTNNQVLIGGEDRLKERLETQFDNIIKKKLSSTEQVERKLSQTLKESTKEARNQISTLLKTNNVSFLLGAGCSIDAGGISLASIPYEIESRLIDKGIKNGKPQPWLVLLYEILKTLIGDKKLDLNLRRKEIEKLTKSDITDTTKEEKRKLAIPINLEQFLTKLYTWRAGMKPKKVNITLVNNEIDIPVKPKELDELIFALKEEFIQTCRLPLPDKKDALWSYRQMLKKSLTRPLNLRRINLFTLNYDTLVEQAADAEGIITVDGFIGNLNRAFRPESFDQDLYFPAQTTEGHVHRLDRVVHLHKLHGSLNWFIQESGLENPYGLSSNSASNGDEPGKVLIYPTPLKHGEVLGLPYSELFRRFSGAIVQPLSVLFVIGYGFGDEHVNMIIRQALNIPTFTMIIVDPNPQNEFVKKLGPISDPRIWIINGWGIGTFDGFVQNLLPDLLHEDIQRRAIETARALTPEEPQEEEKSDEK